MEKMMQRVMKRFPLFIAMGFMTVVVSLIIGAVNAGNAAAYYAVAKATRDTSTDLAAVRAGIESTIVWLPYLKFLGLAMILGGITMALGVIATRLQKMGQEILGDAPPKPRSAMLMRLFMMLGMLVIVAGLVVSLNVAGTAASVFSNPVTVIDSAEAGSPLLRDLAAVHSAEAWLEAFKFVGVAFLFLGIVNGLSTIVFALRYQQEALPAAVENKAQAPSGAIPSSVAAD
jgi:hypothetical protein